jgi:hypothetical protein
MTTVQTVDNALQQLLTTAKNFPGASLDICSGHISANGISSLRCTYDGSKYPCLYKMSSIVRKSYYAQQYIIHNTCKS